MSSYREKLCNKDEKGVSIFSPLCLPKRPLDSKTTTTTDYENVKSYADKYSNANCYIPPVYYPKSTATFGDFSTSESVQDWFKDPTYAQIIDMKGNDDAIATDSLKKYHREKAIEKVAGSLIQTL